MKLLPTQFMYLAAVLVPVAGRARRIRAHS